MKITEDEAKELYDEYIDEFADTRVGNIEFSSSHVLEELDPIAYNAGFRDYLDVLIEDGYELDF